MSKQNIFDELSNIAGSDNVKDLDAHEDIYPRISSRDSIAVFPNTVTEVSEILKFANKDSLTLCPLGAGSKMGYGISKSTPSVLLSLSDLNKEFEHNANDLVATGAAGIALNEFQSRLRTDGQLLPLDPPSAQSCTLGGLVASNQNGPMRLRYGTVRELLIGIQIVRADGTVARGGAKVVKNVAGYDLPKLLTGSMGTLGVITETTWRLHPRQESSKTYIATFAKLQKAHETVMALLDSDLVLTCLEVIEPNLTHEISNKLDLGIKKNRYSLAVRIDNVEKAVDDQMNTVVKICNKNRGQGLTLESQSESDFWDNARSYTIGLEDEWVVCSAGVLITDVPHILESLTEASRDMGISVRASSRAANGSVTIALHHEDTEDLKRAVLLLRTKATALGGHLIITSLPLTMDSGPDPWGDLGSSTTTMRLLKSNFDPNNILNPHIYF